jgi:hypothetical protein
MKVKDRPAPLARPRCRHCRERPASRPLALCWGCYHTPGVRALFASSVEQGLGLTAPARPAAVPCRARPGSKERMLTYQRRLEAGEHLWHPDDAPPDLE